MQPHASRLPAGTYAGSGHILHGAPMRSSVIPVVAALAIACGTSSVFRVNVKGPWLALKAAVPLLRRGGAVVLNASINAHLGMPGTSAYAASSFAVSRVARS